MYLFTCISRKRVGQALQFDMDLECQIEAYPPPAIEWYRDNILLNNNQHYRISHFPFDDEHTNTILRVITIEKKQYANYTCKATNIYGQKEGMYAEKKIFFLIKKDLHIGKCISF